MNGFVSNTKESCRKNRDIQGPHFFSNCYWTLNSTVPQKHIYDLLMINNIHLKAFLNSCSVVITVIPQDPCQQGIGCRSLCECSHLLHKMVWYLPIIYYRSLYFKSSLDCNMGCGWKNSKCLNFWEFIIVKGMLPLILLVHYLLLA